MRYIREHIQLQNDASAKGIYTVSGATITCDKEKNKVVSMIMDETGKEIEKNTIYTIASNDFIIRSFGDDMSRVKGKITLKEPSVFGDQAFYLLQWLKEKGTINVDDFYDPANPRFLEGNYTKTDKANISNIRFWLLSLLLVLLV